MRAIMLHLVLVMALITGAMGINAVWQHYHCHVAWTQANPVQMLPCEPVEQVLLEQERLRSMAELNPYCEGKRR